MTAPAITRFVSRAEWGARAPRSVSRRVDPSWLTHHYLGATPTRIRSLADGIRVMQATQAFHMGPDRGWADFAYSTAYDDLGHVYAGRGWGVRTAAQGTNEGNDTSLAALYLGGGSQEPTAKALAAGAWIDAEFSRLAARNLRLRGHRDWKATGCPGDPVMRHLRAGALDATTGPAAAPAPTARGRGGAMLRLAKFTEKGPDGKTRERVFAGDGLWCDEIHPGTIAWRQEVIAASLHGAPADVVKRATQVRTEWQDEVTVRRFLGHRHPDVWGSRIAGRAAGDHLTTAAAAAVTAAERGGFDADSLRAVLREELGLLAGVDEDAVADRVVGGLLARVVAAGAATT